MGAESSTSRLAVRGERGGWLARYLVLDLAGWVGGLAAAAAALAWTARPELAAAAALVGENAAFYGCALVRLRRGTGLPPLALLGCLALEFGPAEALDLLVIRPAALLAAAQHLPQPLVGIVLGTALADLVYYSVAASCARLMRRRGGGRRAAPGREPALS